MNGGGGLNAYAWCKSLAGFGIKDFTVLAEKEERIRFARKPIARGGARRLNEIGDDAVHTDGLAGHLFRDLVPAVTRLGCGCRRISRRLSENGCGRGGWSSMEYGSLWAGWGYWQEQRMF